MPYKPNHLTRFRSAARISFITCLTLIFLLAGFGVWASGIKNMVAAPRQSLMKAFGAMNIRRAKELHITASPTILLDGEKSRGKVLPPAAPVTACTMGNAAVLAANPAPVPMTPYLRVGDWSVPPWQSWFPMLGVKTTASGWAGLGAFGLTNTRSIEAFSADADGDGIADGMDNCPNDFNPNQADADGDGVGDACDRCPGFNDKSDIDADGVPNACDNCPNSANSNQADADGDNVGDVCDNCPSVDNADQADSDQNGTGDACQQPKLTITDVTKNEGHAGPNDFTFTVNLSWPALSGGVTFNIATADGMATQPGDYTPKSLTGQTIPQGSKTYSFTVLVNGDTTVEADETFFVNVTNVVGATVMDSQGEGTITNDDCPTSFTVNDLGDTPDANPGDKSCADATGKCTLRAAIQEANAITACSPLTINFSVTGTINLATALPALNHPNLTINGPGANQLDVHRNAVALFRIFTINSGKTVNLSGLSITNGKVSGFFGGGIISAGILTINNCAISGNEADNGGGLAQFGGSLNMTNSTVSGNTTPYQGSGVNLQDTTATLTNCTISGNVSQNSQGGIANVVFNSTVSTLNLINCTITNNTSVAPFGAVWSTNSTSNPNANPVTTLKNTLVASNVGPNFITTTGINDIPVATPNALLTSLGNNLDSDGTSGFSNGVNGDLIGTSGAPLNALLAALGNYGGTTQTHALLPGSPAINAGNNTGPSTDQRGIARPQQTTTDIGAFESRGFTLAVNSGNNQTAAVTTPFANPLAVTVTSSFGEPVNGGQVTFTPPSSSASATLTGNPATITGGVATSGTVTANATAGGPYTVAAGALGAPTAVNFSLTNSLVPVTVSVPAGVMYSFNGQTVTDSQTFNVAPGSYTLSTTTPQSLGAGVRAVFSSWSDMGAISHSVIVGSTALTITGNFTTQYQLTTAASPANGGTVTPTTESFFDAGTVVSVSATSNLGFTFTNWTGPVANANAAATTVTMNAATSITANFTNPAPTVLTIVPANPTPTTADSVQFTVTFSENVTGVSVNNFSLATAGTVAGAMITNVTGSGTTWTVTVSLGCGGGTLGLNMTNSTGVTDLGGAAVSNLTFVGGTYTVNKTAPVLTTQPAAQTVGQSATATFTAAATGSPSPTLQWQVDSGSGFTNLPGATNTTLNVPNVTLAMNGFKYRAVFTNSCSTVNSDVAVLTVNGLKVEIGDPLLCLTAGGLVGVTATITNNNAAAVNAAFTAILPTTLNGLPGTGLSSIMPGTVNVTASAVTWNGSIPGNTTVTITYKAQVVAGTPANMPICIDSEVIFNGGPKATVQECQVLNCPVNGFVKVSDQKAGSLLVFPYYVSKAAEQKDTRLTITNTSDKPITSHVFFIDGNTCQQADQFLCLSPFASFSFKASDYDPEATGWMLVVAVDATGRPTQANGLIGNAFVKDGEYVDNYGAEAFKANSTLLAAVTASTATLFFDNQSYDAVPNQFAVEIQSPLDAVNQRVVTVGLQGDLTQSTVTGAAQIGPGLVINGNEKPTGSFVTWLNGNCQAQATINGSTPRVPNGLSGMIPKGQVGTMQWKIGAGVGLLLTPRTAAWPGIRTLHKTGSTATTLTIPIVVPVC